jgi:hypothetical protein
MSRDSMERVRAGKTGISWRRKRARGSFPLAQRLRYI